MKYIDLSKAFHTIKHKRTLANIYVYGVTQNLTLSLLILETSISKTNSAPQRNY